jgi:tetratricopeptide (TPR) repeat protein
MKHLTIRAGALAIAGLGLVSLGWSQDYGVGQQPAQQTPPQPGTPAEAAAQPKVSKAEVDAYNKLIASMKAGDPRQKITQGEAFVSTYPNSMYAGVIYSQLTSAYLSVNDTDKMMAAGEKALASDPNNVDVLPLMAWALPRKVSSSTPNAAQELEKAVNYGRRAINLLNTMTKPAEIDDATFTKIKNEKLAQCHSGIGTAFFKTGKYDDSVNELNQAVKLDPTPDPVDYYVLGVANSQTSHFTDAVAAFDKCAATPGQLQANCRNLSAETKKKAANSLEAH